MITSTDPSSRLLQQKSSSRLLDVLIIGGGLSGLMVAHELRSTPLSFCLLEARPVLGGRLANDNKGHLIDMGGAWIWPFQQPNMKRLVSKLSVQTFAQRDDPSSTRIVGGAVDLIHKLAKGLDDNKIQLNSPVVSCTLETQVSCDVDSKTSNAEPASVDSLIRVETASKDVYLARRVVLAAPPRLISKHIAFDPPLSAEKEEAMRSSDTWMVGVTKVALLYSSHFWDEGTSNMGLPSQLGPAFQVYDSSTEDNLVSALTFFTLANTDNDKELADRCATQMGELWSYMRRPEYASQAKGYVDFHVQRWPKEQFVSEDPSPSGIHPHPSPVRALSTSEWNGTLLFAGSESDRSSPGVMEGAIGAALRVIGELKLFASRLAAEASEETSSR